MRFYLRDGEIEVVLSRRNLLAGLHKLDMAGSGREIQTDGADVLLRLRFEEDGEHYLHPDRHAGARPGAMHPDTEVFITENS